MPYLCVLVSPITDIAIAQEHKYCDSSANNACSASLRSRNICFYFSKITYSLGNFFFPKGKILNASVNKTFNDFRSALRK